jgi:hypothetical protein
VDDDSPSTGPTPGRVPTEWGGPALCRVLVAALVLVVTSPLRAEGQTVVGTVLDGQSGEGVPAATVSLLGAEGVLERRTETDGEGRFLLPARTAGTYTLEVQRIGFASTRTEPLSLESEVVEVEVRLFPTPIELASLTVVGRRRDARHEATFEGALARHQLFPRAGTRRVILRGDPEFGSSIPATDILRRLPPIRECVIVHQNGIMAQTRETAMMWLEEVSTENLEALEYYRYWSDAPVELKDFPSYLGPRPPTDCSVVALWPRVDPPPARPLGRMLWVGGIVGALFLVQTLLLGS